MTNLSPSDDPLAANYTGKHVLITGAGGFIGLHLATHLSRLGAIVEASAKDKTSVKQGAANVTVSQLDVSDMAAVEAALQGKHFDVVFHLAAKPAGDRSKEQMAVQAKVTLGGTINLATALLNSPDTLLVHIGSSEEYGTGKIPFFENQVLAPISPYGAAKAAASQFLIMAGRSFGLPVIIARPSVVFGPGQSTDMVIPYLFDCYQKKQPAQISPGEETRDFVYIDDCVEGLLMLGARPDLAGECFNLGSGVEVKLKRVAFDIARLAGYDGDLGLGSRPYGLVEVMEHKESPAKALDKLGWQAETSFSDGLLSTYQWWQSQGK